MKQKLISGTCVLVSFIIFLLIIILTNDTIKQKAQIDKILPILTIISMMLVIVVILTIKKRGN